MKRQISSDQLYEAFKKGKLGTAESYAVWTPLWAVRSKIWRKKGERKIAREAFGELALEAIDLGDPDSMRQVADALEQMMLFEQRPENTLLADVYFAVEDLNSRYSAYSKADLLSWLNKEMEAVLTAPEVEGALAEMGMADAIPGGKKLIKR